jgi:site-specific recombinase XerD
MFGAFPPRQQVLDPNWLVPSDHQARNYVQAIRSPNTLRAYRTDWTDFCRWCAALNCDALPATPSTVVLYLNDVAKVAKFSTITRRISAIRQAHKMAGFESPTQNALVRELIANMRRTLQISPVAKRPVLVEDLKAMLGQLPETVLGIRDRALLLLGFSGAFRRSELVALDCEDLARGKQGLVATVRPKWIAGDDPTRTVIIPFGSGTEGTCPVTAVGMWQRAAGIESGALFRVLTRHGHILNKRLSGEAVSLVVKRWVKYLGYNPAQFGGHSLRAGLATSAAMAGKPERAIMQQTGHRSLAAMRRYVREGNLFRENAAEGIGL